MSPSIYRPDLDSNALRLNFGRAFRDVVSSWKETAESHWIQEGERLPEVDLCKEAGCRLRFCHPSYIRVPESARDETIFCSVVFHARGDFDSPGFAARLPYRISFTDPAPVVLAKMGRRPDEETSISGGGKALDLRGDCVGWMYHLDAYSLHLLRVTDGTALDSIVRVLWIHRASKERMALRAR